MRHKKYKGVVDPGKVSHTKTDLEDDSLEPAYVKKYLKRKERKSVIQLKLFGNPYDPNY
jgi:hypothetical protein